MRLSGLSFPRIYDTASLIPFDFLHFPGYPSVVHPHKGDVLAPRELLADHLPAGVDTSDKRLPHYALPAMALNRGLRSTITIGMTF